MSTISRQEPAPIGPSDRPVSRYLCVFVKPILRACLPGNIPRCVAMNEDEEYNPAGPNVCLDGVKAEHGALGLDGKMASEILRSRIAVTKKTKRMIGESLRGKRP